MLKVYLPAYRYIVVFLFATLSAFSPKGFAQSWQYTGSPLFSQNIATTVLALDPAGTPYIVFRDDKNIGGITGRVTVMKYDGGAWVGVGNPGISTGFASSPSIAIDASGTPYVAYSDGTSIGGIVGKATVMKYNGIAWVAVGSPGFSIGNATTLSLALDASGTPYVAYRDASSIGGITGRATLMKYDGIAWVAVGNPGFSAGKVSFTSLAIDASGTPHVAYVDATSIGGIINRATVMKYNGSAWVAVGNPGFSASSMNTPSLVINASGTPYIAYPDAAVSSKITVMTYNGSAWVPVGIPGFSISFIGLPRLAIDASGTPYVVYEDLSFIGGIQNRATVMKYDGISWVPVGSPGFSPTRAWDPSIAINASGKVYVSFEDFTVSNGGATVMQFESTVPASFTTCPSNMSTNAANGVCNAVINYAATAGGIPTPGITYTLSGATTGSGNGTGTGSAFNTGITIVTIVAANSSGNAVCNFAVTVTDTEAPVALCQNQTVVLANGTASVTGAQVNNGSTDNCGIASMTVSPNTFTCANIGNNTVTLTVADVNGNVATCNAVVNVQGDLPGCSVSVTPSNNTYTGGVATDIYIGYGPQSATISANASGGSGFTYSWSGLTSALNCTNCQSPVFTPTAGGIYTYTVTATNSNGCSTTCQVSFCVKDIRDGNNKVFICHAPPGNPGNAKTHSISANAVASHIGNHSGDRLGKCDQDCGSAQKSAVEEVIEMVSGMKVYPNPSTGIFVVALPDVVQEGEAIITDMTGKQIERKMFHHDTQLNFNLSDVAKGIYMLRVVNGTAVYRAKVTIN